MPHHIHTAPQCGFWTGHDPSCADQGLGPETDCILIDTGKNKGKYLCIHRRPPERGSGYDLYSEEAAPKDWPRITEPAAGTGLVIVKAPGFKPGEEERFQRLLPGYFMTASPSQPVTEYQEIRVLLHDPDPDEAFANSFRQP